jgi:hypothetical protein
MSLAAMPAPASAEKRIALVIGNSAYLNTAELKNPSHDAADLSAALKGLGFEVLEGRDLDKRAMERTIRQFGTMLSGADVALFFYAGHGLQVGRQNYLVPTDARLASEGDIDFEALPLNLVLKQMEREAKTNLVLLDACRDNPLARNLARSMGTRAALIPQGLAEVKTGVGTLIGFSTQPDNVAVDGDGRNSPYAGALLKHIAEPGKDVGAILVSVRNDVLKLTNGRQVPWEHTSLTGQVFFSPQAAAPDLPAKSLPPVPNYDREMEIAFWNAVKDSKSPAVLQTYLDRFPSGTFAGLARVLIEQLSTKAPAAGSKEPPASTREKVASVPQKPDEPKPQEPPATDPTALARALQTELRRVGCDPGGIDGKWGANATDALGDFARRTKVKLSASEPTQEALKEVAGHKGRVCPIECGSGEKEVNGRCVAKAKPERRTRAVERAAPRGRASSEGSSGGSHKMCWSAERGGAAIVSCDTPGALGR